MQTRELELIEVVNAARRRGQVAASAEAQLDSLFGTAARLAVYGSLAPGRQNHHIVAPLGGTWTEGVVEGDLTTYGWGAAIGYPALRLRPAGPTVSVHVLTSEALRGAWPNLDAFEGAEYRRVLVPVWSDGKPEERRLLSVANLYEAASTALPILAAQRITSAGRRGSSRPLIIETSAGERLVKLRGAAQGPAPLVAEVIVGALADSIGLPVPPRSVVDLPAEIETADWDDELADLLAASVGHNLGFDFLPDAREFARSDVERVAPEMRAAILWLDRLVTNPDRTIQNPNLVWSGDQLWLIDHGAALGFQYAWPTVSESRPREPGWTPDAHLFESIVPNDELRAADAVLARRVTREVLDAAVGQVPRSFLEPLIGGQSVERRRAAYAAVLWKRLREPRPFVDARELPQDRVRGARPAWLRRR